MLWISSTTPFFTFAVVHHEPPLLHHIPMPMVAHILLDYHGGDHTLHLFHTTSPPSCHVGPAHHISSSLRWASACVPQSLFSSLALPPSNVNRHTPPSSAYTNVLAQCNTDYDLRPLLSNASSRASPSPCTDTVHLAWVMLHDVSWRMTRRGCLHNFQSSFHLR